MRRDIDIMMHSVITLTVLHAGVLIMILNYKSRIRDYMRFTFVLLVLCAIGMTSAANEIHLRITAAPRTVIVYYLLVKSTGLLPVVALIFRYFTIPDTVMRLGIDSGHSSVDNRKE